MDQIERMDQMMDKLDNRLTNTELEKLYKLKCYHCGEYGYKKQIVQTKIVLGLGQECLYKTRWMDTFNII